MRLILVVGLLLIARHSMAQTDNVTGKIVDENGNPAAGTNIIQKGTTNGTVTDVNGEFKMKVPEGKSVLVFAFIGYKMLEMEVSIDANSQYQADVILTKDTQVNKRLSRGKLTQKR